MMKPIKEKIYNNYIPEWLSQSTRNISFDIMEDVQKLSLHIARRNTMELYFSVFNMLM